MLEFQSHSLVCHFIFLLKITLVEILNGYVYFVKQQGSAYSLFFMLESCNFFIQFILYIKIILLVKFNNL